ncbi:MULTISPECIES: YgiW/YdeI family stress tolerance OB fold protein [Vibrio]|uniref:Uncharacterized protein n=1 Tax=Vibrio proteolyticus NBRC 13287 TaxID=1219065 RepID=U3A0R9_VIBPR|nr:MULTISPECIES: NirD/YgiW/YdeI family stress tolerance protein [Vibrio]NAW56281.1 NirD/YgiW/YdeI family stress tolerance protein [Vibrio sp. V36_P2S2PM302]NAX21405.1 NirD/YgiW/YdeI family stress tolerance protein [Vibrio sp. V39_P1S14PM300]NAX27226.1 NirD/YgiW/YdeI family stress tolerance protein [Vibrio sp. V38_P2S17PM301]NAX29708.1 NirD/YgiW/YdeI family stress tolerance protein [Vibrio sp. V37_P2S8PM304]GAD67285.1 hypothetical protein VPR01S_07_00840 [Vibrio proteolyticus NBRC 13287]
MKKTIIALTAALTLSPALALANSTQTGIQYNGPVEVSSVKQLLADANMFTEKDVVVEGHLLRQVRKDTFIFSDGDGEVQIEFDDDIHFNTPLNAETKVRLYGEFEGGQTPEIEVEQVQLL